MVYSKDMDANTNPTTADRRQRARRNLADAFHRISGINLVYVADWLIADALDWYLSEGQYRDDRQPPVEQVAHYVWQRIQSGRDA